MTARPERIASGAANRLALVTLVGFLVALLGFLAPPASAAPLLHPETRVAAIAEPAGQLVGPSRSVLPGESRQRTPNYDSSATGSSVAAEGGAAGGGPLELANPETVNNAASPIRSFATAEDQTYYRVFSGSNTEGAFLTGAPPGSSQAAIEGLALPPGNTAEFLQEVHVPAGTMLQSSIAAEAFGQPGGLLQFQLLERIDPKFFGPGMPFP